MAQWGNSLSFKRGDTCINVMSHVDTGSAFTPFDSSSGVRKTVGTIDLLLLGNVIGDQDVADKMLLELRERFVGKPYQEWLDAERVFRAIPM